MKTLRQKLLAKDFGEENVEAIENNPEGFIMNRDINESYVNLLKAFYNEDKGYFNRLFSLQSKPYTEEQLAKGLIAMGLANNVNEAFKLVPELVEMTGIKRGTYVFRRGMENGKFVYRVKKLTAD